MAERRRWPRYLADRVRGQLISESRQAGWPVVVLNLSRGGVRLALGHRVQPGREVIVRLDRLSREVSTTARVRVVRLSDRFGDRFIVGGAFTRLLDPDELGSLL
jgi:hypothetical protein